MPNKWTDTDDLFFDNDIQTIEDLRRIIPHSAPALFSKVGQFRYSLMKRGRFSYKVARDRKGRFAKAVRK